MVQLNHTIVWVHDKTESAEFYTSLLGLPPATPFFDFLVVAMDNGVSLDLYEQGRDAKIDLQHYAFLVAEEEFDQVFARIRERKLEYWADPGRTQAGEINRHFGGRGVHFMDPNGHLLEIITTPYGDESELA